MPNATSSIAKGRTDLCMVLDYKSLRYWVATTILFEITMYKAAMHLSHTSCLDNI